MQGAIVLEIREILASNEIGSIDGLLPFNEGKWSPLINTQVVMLAVLYVVPEDHTATRLENIVVDTLFDEPYGRGQGLKPAPGRVLSRRILHSGPDVDRAQSYEIRPLY